MSQIVAVFTSELYMYLMSCGVRGRCRISPPHFLAEEERRLNQGSFVSAVCLVVCFL